MTVPIQKGKHVTSYDSESARHRCDDDVVKNLPGPATPLLACLSPTHKQTIPGYSSEGDRSCHRGTNKKPTHEPKDNKSINKVYTPWVTWNRFIPSERPLGLTESPLLDIFAPSQLGMSSVPQELETSIHVHTLTSCVRMPLWAVIVMEFGGKKGWGHSLNSWSVCAVCGQVWTQWHVFIRDAPHHKQTHLTLLTITSNVFDKDLKRLFEFSIA